eukprot:158724_1
MSQKTWILLKPLNHTHYAAPCLLTDEYVIISTAEPQNRGKIYSVHLEDNKWFNIGKLGIDPLRYSAVVDRDKQIVYVYSNTNTSNDIFFEIDIKTQSCIMYKGVIHGLPEGLGSESGGNVELCILNNTIHAIGGYSSALHSIWKNDNDNKINTFIQNVIGNRPKHQSLHGHALVTIESLNQILILGGKDNSIFGGYLRDIWVCQTQKQMQWTKLTETILPHKLCSFGCIKTNDEKYIIIFGGKTASGVKDEIWMLSTVTWKWHKSAFKCPKKSKYFAVITASDNIHLFAMDTNKHWKIELTQIISDEMLNEMENGIGHGHSRSVSNSITISEDEKKIIHENQDVKMTKLNVQYMKVNNDKHYEETINELRMRNNMLTEQLVNVSDSLGKVQKEYDKWKMKYEEMEGDLNKMNDDYKVLNENYKDFMEQDKWRTLNDTCGYKNWSYNDIIHWVSYLDAGRFEKYIHVLNKNLRMEKIKAEFLPDLDKHDIHRLGVTEYEDKKVLLEHFQSLGISNVVDEWDENAMFAHIVI